MRLLMRAVAGKLAALLLTATVGAWLAWRYSRSRARLAKARQGLRDAMDAARQALEPGGPPVSLAEAAARVGDADIALTAVEAEHHRAREARRNLAEKVGRLTAAGARRKANGLGV